MALLGRFWLKETLSVIQIIALCIAALGVIHELWHNQTFSWSSLWVCLIYPYYYLSRKAMRIPPLQGITLDTCIIAVPCLIYLIIQEQQFSFVMNESRYWYLLPALGLVSAIGLSANLKSSQQIPISIFSVLSYLEPTLLFLIAIFWLNTPVFPSDYVTYVPIWISLILLGINGLMKKHH